MSATVAPPARLVEIAGLLGEIGELKRVRSAGRAGSAADRLFLGAWGALKAGGQPERISAWVGARTIAAARLGDLDAAALRAVGLSTREVEEVLVRGLEPWLHLVPPAVRAGLSDEPAKGAPPPFANDLADQPRAGATRPGHPRLVLEPAESHAGHCLVVAVGGFLLADSFGADPTVVFLAGLGHHLHNARLPDAGFAGEAMLGDLLPDVIARLGADALAELPTPLAADVSAALAATVDDGTPEGRAHHGADVLDRVLEVEHYARAASVTRSQMLDDMELVHAGPLQGFQRGILAQAGLR